MIRTFLLWLGYVPIAEVARTKGENECLKNSIAFLEKHVQVQHDQIKRLYEDQLAEVREHIILAKNLAPMGITYHGGKFYYRDNDEESEEGRVWEDMTSEQRNTARSKWRWK